MTDTTAKHFSTWKVYCNSNFWAKRGQGRPGIEIPVGVRFDWEGQAFFVPSVYSCFKGLVVDVCIETPAKEICGIQAEIETPPDGFSYTPEIWMNGRALKYQCGCSLSWNPCMPEDNPGEAKAVLDHYNLDPEQWWTISRYSFPWGRSRRPEINTLSLTLHPDLVALPGLVFQGKFAGERIEFTHPQTGAEHVLTVEKLERKELPRNFLAEHLLGFPRHYMALTYALDLPREGFSLVDQIKSDPLYQIKENSQRSAIGIIGGADGPTAIYITGGKAEPGLRTACSSLHYSDEFEVAWQMIFHVKNRADVTAVLI